MGDVSRSLGDPEVLSGSHKVGQQLPMEDGKWPWQTGGGKEQLIVCFCTCQC